MIALTKMAKIFECVFCELREKGQGAKDSDIHISSHFSTKNKTKKLLKCILTSISMRY